MEEIWPDYPTDEDYLWMRMNIKITKKSQRGFFLINYNIHKLEIQPYYEFHK
jgi:hypothetical protein